MVVLSKYEKELFEICNRFIFLKCNYCNFKFANRWGFYTVCSCPSCKKDVWITVEEHRLDKSLAEGEKSILINEYYLRKLKVKIMR